MSRLLRRDDILHTARSGQIIVQRGDDLRTLALSLPQNQIRTY
jgi:hypothetical protein